MLRACPTSASDVRDDCPWWAPPVLAIQFLTRLPVPGTAALSPESIRIGLVQSVAWFPLVGALVGAITAVVALAGSTLWPVYVAVVLALIVEARLTGAFHEDAVADFCDAFGGGQTADDIRRIMKDSRIGSYGSLGLMLAVGLRAGLTIALLTTLPPLGAAIAIVAAATFERLVVVVVMGVVQPAAGSTGLAKDVASGVGAGTCLLAFVTATPGLLCFGIAEPIRLLAGSAAAALFVLWFRWMLERRLGGTTGDCLGFAAYVGQLLLLLSAVAR